MRAVIPKGKDGKYRGLMDFWDIPYRMVVTRGPTQNGVETIILDYEPEPKADKVLR